jgi:hypothetical protein
MLTKCISRLDSGRHSVLVIRACLPMYSFLFKPCAHMFRKQDWVSSHVPASACHWQCVYVTSVDYRWLLMWVCCTGRYVVANLVATGQL